MEKQRHTRFWPGTSVIGICLALALPPDVADAADSQWQEGIHYTLTKTAADQEWLGSTIRVAVFVSYASAETAKSARDFPKWKATLPDFVDANLRPFVHDEQTLALGRLFLALENLKRTDLHLTLFLEQHTPGKSLVVMKSADTVDFGQTQQLQERLLQQHGVSPEDLRRAISDPSIDKEILRIANMLITLGEPRGLPAVYVNDKYITSLILLGAKVSTDAMILTDKLFEVTNHLIARTDIDNVQAASMESLVLRDLAKDPVLHVWHTVVPNLFEVERRSGIWYLDRDGGFGGPYVLTDLDTGKTLTGTGAARLELAQASAAMRAKTLWADPQTVALRVGAPGKNVGRDEFGHVWKINQSVNRREVQHFLTADGRYHLMTAAQTKDIASWQATLDSLASGPGAANAAPLEEGTRGSPSSPQIKAMRAKALANIADADTIVYAPAGTVRATLTAFLDPKCHACRRLHRDAQKVAAQGIRLRFVPIFNTPLATNIWCARDRRAALGHAMREVSLWPACAREVRDGFAPLYRGMLIENSPSTFNSRGEIVSGYTTPDELIRVLLN